MCLSSPEVQDSKGRGVFIGVIKERIFLCIHEFLWKEIE